MTESTLLKKAAAQELADWFRNYRTPDSQFDGPGYEALVLIAVKSICGANDNQGATEDEVEDFVQGIRELVISAACLSLIKDGQLATSVIDGQLVFGALDPA